MIAAWRTNVGFVELGYSSSRCAWVLETPSASAEIERVISEKMFQVYYKRINSCAESFEKAFRKGTHH